MFGTVEEQLYPLVGIVENVVIEKIEYVDETSQAGNAYKAIDVYLKQPNGSSVRARYFEPSNNGDEELFEKSKDRFNRAFQQLAVAVGNKEDYAKAIVNDGTLSDFASKFIAYYKANASGKKLRVKFVYKGSNISPATANPVQPTFESMDIPQAESRMKINLEYDKMEPAPQKVDNDDAAQMISSDKTEPKSDGDWMDS